MANYDDIAMNDITMAEPQSPNLSDPTEISNPPIHPEETMNIFFVHIHGEFNGFQIHHFHRNVPLSNIRAILLKEFRFMMPRGRFTAEFQEQARKWLESLGPFELQFLVLDIGFPRGQRLNWSDEQLQAEEKCRMPLVRKLNETWDK